MRKYDYLIELSPNLTESLSILMKSHQKLSFLKAVRQRKLSLSSTTNLCSFYNLNSKGICHRKLIKITKTPIKAQKHKTCNPLNAGKKVKIVCVTETEIYDKPKTAFDALIRLLLLCF